MAVGSLERTLVFPSSVGYGRFTRLQVTHMMQAAPVRVSLILSFSLALVSCAPPHSAAPPQSAIPDVRDVPLAEFGQLQIFSPGLMTDGRNIKVRGRVRNPYPEPIEGIRVVFLMMASPENGARVLDRFQEVLHDRLAYDEQAPLRFDVQTMYAGMGGMNRFELLAFAIKRGGQYLPLPPGWKE